MSKKVFKNKVCELVEIFERNEADYKSSEFNEAQNRIQFIDPFFEALGWDISNKQGFSEQYKEVIHEDKVEVKGKPQAPDYSFRIGESRKFFVEAKKPLVRIKHDFPPSYQLRRYAWSAKLPVSILTDFEEFSLYDAQIEPKSSDKVETARIDYFHYKDYPKKWEEMYNTFSKEAILKGSFDKFVKKAKRGTQEVDKSFLKEIEKWRELLAKDIAKNNSKIDTYKLNFAVQRIIDRLIFLRIAEDRGIEDYENLKNLIEYKDSYSRLVRYCKVAYEKYDSNLFDLKEDTLTPKLKVTDRVLDKILENLYFPKSPYEFSVIGVEILGNIYEQFLGKVIRLTRGHNAVVEEKPEVKKAGGVYYTPEYIVDYIVKNTVGELIKPSTGSGRGRKTPKQIEKIKILDPACGSGSFLIGAYEYLLDYHLEYYTKQGRKNKKKVFRDEKGTWHLTTAEKKKILLNNIYGVDIDSQAVEVTKLSLALKLLENEDQETINQQRKLFPERLLPDLSDNIKCGNSLIGSDFWEGKNLSMFDEEEVRKINAFDWEEEFPQAFEEKVPDAFFITWVTHNSRVSERMVRFGVKRGKAVKLTEKEEVKLTEIIGDIVKDEGIDVLSYNICQDHVHMVVVCLKEELSEIVRKLKGKSAYLFNKWKHSRRGLANRAHPPNRDNGLEPLSTQHHLRTRDNGLEPLSTQHHPRTRDNGLKPIANQNHLWAQKFNQRLLDDGNSLDEVIDYIETNREKHGLGENKGLKPLVQGFVANESKAFRSRYEGGFDAVIGNPPYGAFFTKDESHYFEKKFNVFKGVKDSYTLFTEAALSKTRNKGLISFILPSAWLGGPSYLPFREHLISCKIQEIVTLPFDVFKDAYVDTLIFIIDKSRPDRTHHVKTYSFGKKEKIETIYIKNFKSVRQKLWQISKGHKFVLDPEVIKIFNRIDDKTDLTFDDMIEMKRGVLFDKKFLTKTKKSKKSYRYFEGDVYRYIYFPKTDNWIEFGDQMKECPKETKWFQEKRILMRRLINRRQRLMSAISSKKFITNKNLYSILKRRKGIKLLTILGLLNSRLISYLYIKRIPQGSKDDFPQVTIRDILLLPFPNEPMATTNKLSSHVRKMLNIKKQLHATKSEAKRKVLQKKADRIDRKIDQLVYKLYGLNKKEIKIVEASSNVS